MSAFVVRVTIEMLGIDGFIRSVCVCERTPELQPGGRLSSMSRNQECCRSSCVDCSLPHGLEILT